MSDYCESSFHLLNLEAWKIFRLDKVGYVGDPFNLHGHGLELYKNSSGNICAKCASIYKFQMLKFENDISILAKEGYIHKLMYDNAVSKLPPKVKFGPTKQKNNKLVRLMISLLSLFTNDDYQTNTKKMQGSDMKKKVTDIQVYNLCYMLPLKPMKMTMLLCNTMTSPDTHLPYRIWDYIFSFLDVHKWNKKRRSQLLNARRAVMSLIDRFNFVEHNKQKQIVGVSLDKSMVEKEINGVKVEIPLPLTLTLYMRLAYMHLEE